MSDPPTTPATETAPATEPYAPPREQGQPAAQKPIRVWSRIVWWVLPLVFWAVASQLPLLGVDYAGPHLRRGVWGALSLLVLGLAPILVGSALVEVVAAAVPPWRAHRHTRRGRAILDGAAVVVSFLIVGYQGASLLWPALMHPSFYSRFLVILTLLAVTSVLWLVLRGADRRGAGSSFALLAGLGGLVDLLRIESEHRLGSAPLEASPQPWTLNLLLLLTIVTTLMVVNKPVREPEDPARRARLAIRAPASGLAPFWLVTPALVFTIPGIGNVPELRRALLVGWFPASVALAVLSPWLLQWPRGVGAVWARLFEPGASSGSAAWAARARAALWRAMLPTVAYLAVVLWPAWPVLARIDDPATRVSAVAGVCLFVAAICDVVGEMRFRRAHRDADGVLVEQRPHVADAALAALAEAQIPAFARNIGVRSLLSFLGPWAPIEILVPGSMAQRARERLAGILEPGSDAPRA